MAKPPKRLWTVQDVARFIYGEQTAAAHRRALRLLKRLDAAHGGGLLRGTPGAPRGYRVSVAALRRADPDLLESYEPVDERLDRLEDQLEQLVQDFRMVAKQVGANSGAIGRLMRGRPRAA